MIVGEAPVWRVASFDTVTRAGVAVSGASRVSFEHAAEPDLEVGERIFVSLRDDACAKAIWPAVAHLDCPEPVSPRRSTWSPSLDELPYPLEATIVRQGHDVALLADDRSPNEYVPWGADVSIAGELRLLDVTREVGRLHDGQLAVRAATARERGWLDCDRALIVSVAGRFAHRAGSPVAVVLRDAVWLEHDPERCRPLDDALARLWGAHGAPAELSSNAGGRVFARYLHGAELLGEVDAAHARRWVTAFSGLLGVGSE